jgi:D-beta-D-heptose 7-phosphate kinase/D-beta-D-heptose 1-phosphate adenosyltransferase
MSLFNEDGVVHIPTRARLVHDVSGAGDTVIATIMTALVAGASMKEAATIATYAASVVVAEVGAVPVDKDKLKREILDIR